LLTNICVAQQLPINDKGEVEYTEVVSVDGSLKKQLFDKAKFWIVSTLKSGDNMVELGGDNSDQIVGTGNLILENIKTGWDWNNLDEVNNAYVNFKFIIFCKEGRYKYELSNILISYIYNEQGQDRQVKSSLTNLNYPSYVTKQKVKDKFKANTYLTVDQALKKLITDFKSDMATESKKDDW